jgi:hypothetical protein
MLFFNKRTPVALRLAVGAVLIVLGVTLHMLLLTIAGALALVIGGAQWFGGHGNRGGGQ